MIAEMWTFFLVPLFICGSSNGQQSSVDRLQEDSCKTYTIPASLGSSVLLPCIFSTTGLSGVSWAHVDNMDLILDVVNLTSDGQVHFLDPRQGRVKAFPNQASVGNFSISIDELKKSDLGSYICKEEKSCIEVELQEDNKGEQFDEDLCDTNTLRAPLGSSVLLSCIFSTNGGNWVIWNRLNNPVLLRLSSNGRVQFLDPKQGRVKVFPNQASVGNFSIGMDELKDSDLGSYRCRKRNKCFQVDLLEDKSTLDADAWRLIYICVGVAVLILLSCVGYYCWLKCPGLWRKIKQDNTEVSENTAGASAPPQEAHQPQIGVDNNSLVYENDGQYLYRNPPRTQSDPAGDPQHQDQTQPHQSNIGIYPNLNEFKFERVESHKTRQRFHIELFRRLRQASINRHFYVNQHEINRQQAMAAQEQNQRAASFSDCQYQNPIYNRSTEQLSQM